MNGWHEQLMTKDQIEFIIIDSEFPKNYSRDIISKAFGISKNILFQKRSFRTSVYYGGLNILGRDPYRKYNPEALWRFSGFSLQKYISSHRLIRRD